MFTDSKWPSRWASQLPSREGGVTDFATRSGAFPAFFQCEKQRSIVVTMWCVSVFRSSKLSQTCVITSQVAAVVVFQ